MKYLVPGVLGEAIGYYRATWTLVSVEVGSALDAGLGSSNSGQCMGLWWMLGSAKC